MSDEVLVVRAHFDQSLRKRHHGLITIVGLADEIVAGIGNVPFLTVRFLVDRISIMAGLPILPSQPEKVLETGEPYYGCCYCIKLNKHRKKGNIAVQELIAGLAANKPLPTPSGMTSFEYNHPESIHAAEYIANKIISIVRRKVRVSGHNAFLKDPADKTNLIEFATKEWERNKPRFTRK